MLGIERVIFRLQRLDIIAVIGRVEDFGNLGHPVGDFIHTGQCLGAGFGAAANRHGDPWSRHR
jgi:hypothetical protein